MEWVAPKSSPEILSAPAREPAANIGAVLAALADSLALAFRCDTVVVRLRDSTGHWTSAQHGSTGLGCLLEHSLALVAAEQIGPLIAADAASHPILRDHPLVANSTQVRSFAGIAAFAEDDGQPENGSLGMPIGVICALSSEHREFGDEVAVLLENMALLLRTHYAQRSELALQQQQRARLELERDDLRRLQRQFRQAERMAAIGYWRLSIADQQIHWSEGVYAIHELPPGSEVPVDDAINFYAPGDREAVGTCIERAVTTGEGWDLEADFVTAKGRRRRVRSVGEVELLGGQPVALVGVFQDISDRHELLTELERRANTDALTGLPNRALFDERLASAVRSTKDAEHPLGVVLIDLDNFKSVNDEAGHAAGDELLCRAAAILQGAWLGNSFAARLGGDELVLLLQDAQQVDNLKAVLKRLTDEFAIPMDYYGGTLVTGASIGATIMQPGGICSGSALLETADRALYEAKRDGKGRYAILPSKNCEECRVGYTERLGCRTQTSQAA